MGKIMVTGATGHLGSQVLKLLIQKTNSGNLSAISRDTTKLEWAKEKGVNVVQADYNDKSSLAKAFQGTEKLYFVSGSDLTQRVAQHKNVVAAAKEAGVKHVAYTSFQRKNETASSPTFMISESHLLAEKLLKDSGMNYTILKHALYSDVIPMFVGNEVLEKGMIYLPAGDGKVSYATRSDMAKAGASVLTGEGHENKVYEISGSKSYSFGDVAQILSKISGKEIVYVAPSVDEFKETLLKAGVPEEIIGRVVPFAEGIKQGEFNFPSADLEKLIGEKPEELEEFLTKVYSK